MAVPECPVKAADFDEKHRRSTRTSKVKNHAGARELAGQYTTGILVKIHVNDGWNILKSTATLLLDRALSYALYMSLTCQDTSSILHVYIRCYAMIQYQLYSYAYTDDCLAHDHYDVRLPLSMSCVHSM